MQVFTVLHVEWIDIICLNVLVITSFGVKRPDLWDARQAGWGRRAQHPKDQGAAEAKPQQIIKLKFPTCHFTGFRE